MLELEGPYCSTVRRRVRPKQSGPPKPGYPASAVCRLREVLCAGEKAQMVQNSGIGRTYHASQHPMLREPSVPIPKFLCTFCVGVECAAAEAVDGREDVIGGFCPAERLGRGISDFDISGDRGFQFGYGSMRAALDLLLGQEREEALDLIDPG